MFRSVSLPLVLVSACLCLSAKDFDVRAFGAKGDGVALDTNAINKAVEAASTEGGGTVVIPAGTYASHSIRLKSRICLRLEAGAVLLAAEPPAGGGGPGYDDAEPNASIWYQDFGHTHFRNSLIWGEGLEDVSIIGPGRIYGKGLSRGNGRVSLPVGVFDPHPKNPPPDVLEADGEFPLSAPSGHKAGPFNHPAARDILPPGTANKAIALKNCRNVILRDFSVLHGGHFAILATGTDNLTIDNLMIDTNRDGMDIDACRNVRISRCSVNSPWDDGICLKSSYALGEKRATENVTISDCAVSGFIEGTLLDGTRRRSEAYRGGPMGRIKLGTESNGGYRNITIANCVFEFCRGLALEQVDGGPMEDITISNLTMRDIVNAPIFVRLGGRLRAPDGTAVGSTRRISISNIIASNVAPGQGIMVVGIPGHPVEELSLSNIRVQYRGGGSAEQAGREVPELVKAYPEPYLFGTLPSWALYARHVRGPVMRDLHFGLLSPDARPAIHLEDLSDATAAGVRLPSGSSGKDWRLLSVSGLRSTDSDSLR